MIKEYNWKNNTLELLFDRKIGRFSSDDTDDGTIDKKIFDTIYNYFSGLDCEIDWRDNTTLEVHNLNLEDKQKIVEELFELIGKLLNKDNNTTRLIIREDDYDNNFYDVREEIKDNLADDSGD